MEVKSGYMQTEMGVIPEDWKINNLADICVKINVGFVGVCEPYFTNEVNGILLIRTGNLQGSKIVLHGSKYVTKIFHSTNKKSQVFSGDILIARHGNSGNAIMLPNNIKEANTLNIVIIRTNDIKVVNIFAVYSINSSIVKNQVITSTAGSTQGVINTGEIAKLKIPLPPTLTEQTAIAIVLSDADTLIQSLEKLIVKKRAIKQGTMQELLKPKEGWVVKKLGDVSDGNKKWSFSGGPFGSNLKSSDYTEEGIRIIQLQNIGDGSFINDSAVYTSTTKADELISCNIYPEEIILSKMGDPVARACIIPGFHDRYLMCSDGIRLSVDKNEYNPYFIYTYINSPIFRILAENASTGSTRKRISLNELRNLELTVPHLPEQDRIATILSAMDEEIAALETKLTKYKQIKQGMMQTLLTGRIRLV